MALSKNKAATNAAHIAKLDLIRLQPYKPEGAAIRAAAAAAGQSLQGYILQAVRERMEREQAQAPGPDQPSGPAEDTPTQGQA